jgi:hypothetical protein
MVRDYFVYDACWFKDENGNWGFGFGFIADPLPFRSMSGFPYPPSESYPYDAEHLRYILEYNTRVINPSSTQQQTVSNQNGFATLSFGAIMVAVALSHATFKLSARYSHYSKKLKRL